MLSFQESTKLIQELLAAVDEGELATVAKLLKNPELSSVNVTNKVRRERERERERCLLLHVHVSLHSMERVLCTSLLGMDV